jgi:hypothetical protein
LAWAAEPPSATPASDLAELASALARVEALLTDAAGQSPDAAAAIERIADIAFVLHEREVEPSLCDALDAAMREISAAHASGRANLQRAQEAAGLLRTLGRRLDAMMAAAAAASAAPQARGNNDEPEGADEFPAPDRCFDEDVAEDGAFAQSVAALAESLPDATGGQAAASARACEQAEDDAGGIAEEPVPPEAVAATSVATSVPDAAAAARFAAPADPPAAAEVEAIDPDEDPGDLFEPAADMSAAAEVAPPLPTTNAELSHPTAPSANRPPQSPTAALAAVSAASSAAANDPLAPIRALSEEELIALFS